MLMRFLSVIAVTLASATAFAIVDPITQFDTTSAQDVALLNRGLTLSEHTFELSARAQWVVRDGPNDFVLRPGFSFGITRNLEVGAEAIIYLEPDSHVFVAPRLVYSVFDSKTVDVALTGLVIFDFDDNDDNLLPIRQFGVPIRIKLLDKLSLFTGNNLVDWRHIGNDDIINLNINVGLGYQMHSDLAIRFDTQLAAINIVGDADSTSIGDVFPLAFSMVYAIANQVDITAGATYYAVDNGSDFLAIDGGLLARF